MLMKKIYGWTINVLIISFSFFIVMYGFVGFSYGYSILKTGIVNINISEIIKAFSSLLWPIFAFYLVYLFRADISALLSRVTKGKIFGQEFELSENIQQLHKSVENTGIVFTDENKDKESNTIVESILREAATSPEAALMLLSSEIEKEAKILIGCIGKLEGKNYISIRDASNILDSHYGLPRYFSSSLKLFLDIRNQIVHGGESKQANILSAIDSGISILRVLQSMPRETHTVLAANVNLYSDDKCTLLRDEVKGVILESESSSGVNHHIRIFPTTKNYFKPGMKVSWEWNNKKAWDSTWYIDQKDMNKKLAWNGAQEFVGNPQ